MEHIVNGLYIGEIKDVSPLSNEGFDPDEFDHVVTIGNRGTPYTTERYDIERKSGPSEPFDEAVTRVRELLSAGEEDVFVHCHVGGNRVVAVTATALAAESGKPLSEALEQIDQKQDVDLHSSIRRMAEGYLERKLDNPE